MGEVDNTNQYLINFFTPIAAGKCRATSHDSVAEKFVIIILILKTLPQIMKVSWQDLHYNRQLIK